MIPAEAIVLLTLDVADSTKQPFNYLSVHQRLVWQKYVSKRKGAVKMNRMVLKMSIIRKHKFERNVCE